MQVEKDPYSRILQETYNLYIADWCNTRGYALTDVVQAFIEDEEYDGQMFVCLEEFEDFEFQDKAYMQRLLPDESYQRYLKETEKDHMDEREKNLLVSKATELGWQVEIDNGNWKFQKSSPAGETLQVNIAGENIHIESKKIGICDVKSLTALTDDFREMVDALYVALSDAKDANYEEEADLTNCELGIYDCATCNINGNCMRQNETAGDE